MSALITLQAVYDSSTDLLKRFDLTPSTDIAWTKFLEEFTEATEALYDLQCRPRNEIFKSHAAMEICDCIVTMTNVLYSAEIDEESITILHCKLRTFYSDDITKTQKQAWIDLHFHVNKWYFWLSTMRYTTIADSASRDLFKDHPMYILKSLLALANLYGLSADDIENAMESVIVKNANKSHLTHEVRDGQIKKRAPVQETQS